MTDFVAKADIEVAAPVTRVWQALTDPDAIAKYFFGSRVSTDWQPGSPITWSGEYDGKPYEDKGEILDVEPGRLLRMTHFSPMTGFADEPVNYHTLTYELVERGGATRVSLSQDNNGSDAEAQRASANWAAMLDGLKRTVEGE
ncbi:SRPBCC family protein [Mycobacterium sp.]|uniref:SRPBCC family protein n=1 Tax=Mycobacterium sp. TaxID=1785 RepID=UPI002C143641|nr:SRPBCC family protein [Mycobacterium sp.]HME47664.1 SRPBCC family protein [Mycobacterium sp.]